jgi:hypothetical protein
MALRTPYRWALGAALAIAAALLWVALRPAPTTGVVLAPGVTPAAAVGDTGAPTLPHTSTAMPEHLLMGERYQDVVQRIRARQVDGRPLFATEQAFAQARQQRVLFAVDVSPAEAARSPLADARRLQDARQWIRYDLQVLAARAEGDRFVLPLSAAQAIEAEIDTVDVVQGQLRWSGRLLGPEGGTFSITQAMGDQYAVGAIRTPAGEFLLEAKGGTGWVVDSGKEFFLPPDGNDTISDDGSHLNHSHHGHKH